MSRRFGLRSATVVRAGEVTEPAPAVAAAAASYLESLIDDHCVVGVGISSTVAQIPRFMRRRTASSGVTVVALTGGAAQSSVDQLANPSDVSAQIAIAVNARLVSLLVPFAFASAEACRAVAAEAQVAEPLQLARRADVAVVGIGQVGSSASLVAQGCIGVEEMAEFEEHGAVGDRPGRFCSVGGQPVAPSLDERVIGLSLQDLRQIRLVVAVAAGSGKADAILGALLEAT